MFLDQKIDAHVHLNAINHDYIRYGIENGFSFLSINTDIPFFPSIEDQENILKTLKKEYPGHIHYATTFSCQDWGADGWLQKCLDRLKKSLDHGAVGVKVWKNIGMSLQDSYGNYIGVDHPSFDPIFDFIASNGIPLLGHIGEPKNCWLPIEEMTVDQDKSYFAQHPEFHMYKHPECPSYTDHLDARNSMLSKHSNLRFVGLHLSSQEWETDEVSLFLDTYPNAMVDLAERICHLQHQASGNWKKVHDFMVKYQDRIIYGTDVIVDGKLPSSDLLDYMEGRYAMHWKFFTQKEPMNAPKVKLPFNGMRLTDEIIHKLYFGNASKFYGI